MNSKMLLAFVGGLVVASGVTYLALKQNATTPAETARANTAPAVAAAPSPSPAAVETPAQEPESTTPPAPAVDERRTRKPSPSSRPQQVARISQPARIPPPPAEAPVSAPPVVQQAPPPVEQQPVAKVEVPPPPSEPPPPPKPNTVTIPAGTTIQVRLGETLTTERNQPGDQFTAVLDRPLVVEGFVIAERGSRAQGRIVELERAGKVRGLARIAIELTQIKTSDGQNVRIRTSAHNQEAENTKKTDAAKVGGGAALGAIIGAIAGGGKGAAIVAGAGGAAGAGDVLLTRGKPAELRVETPLSFRMSEPVTVTERLR